MIGEHKEGLTPINIDIWKLTLTKNRESLTKKTKCWEFSAFHDAGNRAAGFRLEISRANKTCKVMIGVHKEGLTPIDIDIWKLTLTKNPESLTKKTRSIFYGGPQCSAFFRIKLNPYKLNPSLRFFEGPTQWISQLPTCLPQGREKKLK